MQHWDYCRIDQAREGDAELRMEKDTQSVKIAGDPETMAKLGWELVDVEVGPKTELPEKGDSRLVYWYRRPRD
jgi:hypothetical protein